MEVWHSWWWMVQESQQWGRGGQGGQLVLSVQQGMVVGADHLLHRPKPKDWHRNLEVAQVVVGLCCKRCMEGVDGGGRAVVVWERGVVMQVCKQ